LIPIQVELSEETRGHSVTLGTRELFDTHEVDGLIFLCRHGTTEMVAVIEKRIYDLLSG
jgi:hypothetical protein